MTFSSVAGMQISNMGIPDWLAISGALAGLCGGVAGLISVAAHLLSLRAEKIDTLRTALSRAWTNEGSINSTETLFITLELEMQNGDVYGSLQTSARERLLDANLEAHLFSATLTVSERGHEVASVQLRLKGNRNRIKWKVISGNVEHWIPEKTLLWPSVTGVSIGYLP
jgi:hypothetical protein